jgi:hypothetical protein
MNSSNIPEENKAEQPRSSKLTGEPANNTPKRRRTFLNILVAVMTGRFMFLSIVIVTVSVALLLEGSTSGNWRHQEVDIMTGRLRFTRYHRSCMVSQKIESSPLSEALPSKMVSDAKPEWHSVNTFSFGSSVSPHHIFHGGIAQIRSLELLWGNLNPPPDVRRAMAEHVLALWQHSRRDSTADKYLGWFCDQFPEIEEQGERQQAVFDRLLLLKITAQHPTNGVTKFTAYYPDGTVMDEYHAYLNDKGDRVKHGVWTSWHSPTNGEQSVFKDWRLVEKWKPIKRSHNNDLQLSK